MHLSMLYYHILHLKPCANRIYSSGQSKSEQDNILAQAQQHIAIQVNQTCGAPNVHSSFFFPWFYSAF